MLWILLILTSTSLLIIEGENLAIKSWHQLELQRKMLLSSKALQSLKLSSEQTCFLRELSRLKLRTNAQSNQVNFAAAPVVAVGENAVVFN